jgi:dolichol-phosphate mannosyltransferase
MLNGNQARADPAADISPVVRFVRFGIVGGSGVAVNVGLLHVFTEFLHLDYRVSSLFAIELAIVNNFCWNNFWTWGDRHVGSRRALAVRLAKFNLSSGLVAMGVNWGLLIILTEGFGVYYHLSNLIGIGCGTAVNFLVSHHWTFASRRTGVESKS